MVAMAEHAVQADIMFVIEGTAINGAYLNDLKTNYLIPTLEYFSQGTIEDRDYVCESTSTLYGLVVYHAADIMPRSSSDCYGPYSSPQRLLTTLDKLELIGGKGESHANIAEGLATALQAFEDLQVKREGTNILTQKHCVLVCNSPPYLMPVMESSTFLGYTTDQLAALLNERNINLSVLSPRKIPAMFKLFEKAGGDLAQCQTKNYAKDPRHLVLLKGFSLKERPLSPTPSLPIPSLSSPISNVGSPAQPPGYRTPQQPNQVIAPPPSPQQQQQSNQIPGRPFPGGGPPVYSAGGMRPQGPRWQMPPPMQQQRTPNFMGNTGQNQGSALIAQLTQPPSTQFPPHPMDSPMMNPKMSVMHPQQQVQQQQQIRMPGMGMPGQQGMGGQPGIGMMGQNMPMGQQPGMNQQAGMVNPSGMMQQQQQPGQNPVGSSPGGGAASNQTINQGQMNPGQQQGQQQQNQQQGGPQPNQQMGQPGQQQQPGVNNPGMVVRERHTIWQGVLEWNEKAKSPNDSQKVTKQVPCQVSATPKEGEPDLKADSWPQKLIMQLMPKQLIGNIGGAYLKNSTSVLFHPQPCEALESLTRVMSSGFAGCVHFTSIPSTTACDIKVLILLYTVEKKAYLGFIPNDQVAFVDRLRKVIQAQKNSQAMIRQNQVPTSQPQSSGSSPIASDGIPSSQSAVIMSQTNTMTMGGGHISQQPDGVMGGMNQGSGKGGQGRGSPMMMNCPRPPFNQIEAARQNNLAKIQQLQQTLEAAQQQEIQYKSQLEVINHIQIQQSLEQAQQQEMNYQAQLEQEQKNQQMRALQMQQQQQQQRQLAPQQMQQQQPGQQQRMVRPQMGPNPGLRHLLQQQQTPYRQQMMGMNNMRPNQPNQQQFDDVSNFDFMN